MPLYVGRGFGKMKLKELERQTCLATGKVYNGIFTPTPSITVEAFNSPGFSAEGTLISAFTTPHWGCKRWSHWDIAHVHACAHVHTHTHTHACRHVYTHTRMHAHTHTCRHTCTRAHVHTHTHTHACTHTHIYTHLHTNCNRLCKYPLLLMTRFLLEQTTTVMKWLANSNSPTTFPKYLAHQELMLRRW